MNWIASFVTTISACLAGGALWWWLQVPPDMEFERRLANEENQKRQASVVRIDVKGTFESFTKAFPTRSVTEGEWTTFRGGDYDAISKQNVPLLDSWPAEGPKVQWTIKLGEGYAAPAIKDGLIYIMDYDEEKEADCLRCFRFDNGYELWRRWYKVKIKRNHGISRTVPATDGKVVVGLGPKCHVLCCDAKTGDFKWGFDLVADYGTKVPLWYAGQCPIIDNGNVILAPSGRVLMTAIEAQTGKVVWETPNPHDWKMSHASIIPMTIHGQRMYVLFAQGGAVGVSPEGKTLWETMLWKHKVVAPSPVQVGNDILITSGYGVGSMLLHIRKNGDSFAVEQGKVWTKKEFACEQQTPIFYEGHVYTVMPNDAGKLRQRLVCMDTDWNMKWSSTGPNRFGLGPFMIADKKIFMLSDDGVLTMAKADSNAYVELASHDVLPGHDAWGPLAIVDGRMVVRDLRTMKCLDLRK